MVARSVDDNLVQYLYSKLFFHEALRHRSIVVPRIIRHLFTILLPPIQNPYSVRDGALRKVFRIFCSAISDVTSAIAHTASLYRNRRASRQSSSGIKRKNCIDVPREQPSGLHVPTTKFAPFVSNQSSLTFEIMRVVSHMACCTPIISPMHYQYCSNSDRVVQGRSRVGALLVTEGKSVIRHNVFKTCVYM